MGSPGVGEEAYAVGQVRSRHAPDHDFDQRRHRRHACSLGYGKLKVREHMLQLSPPTDISLHAFVRVGRLGCFSLSPAAKHTK